MSRNVIITGANQEIGKNKVFTEKNTVRLCQPEELAHTALYFALKKADCIT